MFESSANTSPRFSSQLISQTRSALLHWSCSYKAMCFFKEALSSSLPHRPPLKSQHFKTWEKYTRCLLLTPGLFLLWPFYQHLIVTAISRASFSITTFAYKGCSTHNPSANEINTYALSIFVFLFLQTLMYISTLTENWKVLASVILPIKFN